jgi:hypothetical protein
MSFQNLIEYATAIGIERKPIVAQSVSRDGTVKSVSRGGARWRFSVTLPNGSAYEQETRQMIAALEGLDRFTEDDIQFNNTGHNWIVGYQGDQADPSTVQVTLSGTNTTIFNIAGGVSISSGYLFKAGDYIQATDGVNTGKVYNVAEDVAWNATQIKLHRPQVNEPTYSGTITLNTAGDCVFTVQCIQFPSFSLIGSRQIAYDGDFVLQEVVD